MKQNFGSPVAHSIYGCDDMSKDAWLNYAYALLTIAGADDIVSKEEMNWLMTDFVEIIGADDEFKKDIENFDYRNAVLEEILNQIHFECDVKYKRALVYDAIKMAKADNHFAEKEQQAVENASHFLNIPIYLAKTIKGLVSTERSLEETRQSIFELHSLPFEEYEKRLSENKMKNTSITIRKLFGINKTTDETQLNYGKALMMIAGADGEIAEEEKQWYRDTYATEDNTPDEIVEQVLNFDFQTARMEDVIGNFTVDVSINFARVLFYDAMKMARADDDYHIAEQKAAIKAARLLGVDVNIAHTIEYMIDTEERVEKMRRTLFGLDPH